MKKELRIKTRAITMEGLVNDISRHFFQFQKFDDSCQYYNFRDEEFFRCRPL